MIFLSLLFMSLLVTISLTSIYTVADEKMPSDSPNIDLLTLKSYNTIQRNKI